MPSSSQNVCAFPSCYKYEVSPALIFRADHTEKMHELPDEYLADLMPIAKRIAVAQGLDNYNILQVPPVPPTNRYTSMIYDIHQNNGAIAHQVVKHVHFHVIPKPSESSKEGLVIEWPVQDLSKDDIETLWKDLQPKL